MFDVLVEAPPQESSKLLEISFKADFGSLRVWSRDSVIEKAEVSSMPADSFAVQNSPCPSSKEIERRLRGEQKIPLSFRLWGTAFQVDVWKALCQLDPCERISYGELAIKVGRPKAARAIGQAVGANRLAVFVPCHRVLPKSGKIGGYRWGSVLKERLLSIEKKLERPILSVRWDL